VNIFLVDTMGGNRKLDATLPLRCSPCRYVCFVLILSVLLLQYAAETGAAPINMLDWQAQQKALKDQDRISKTETAKFLQGYRGNAEIDVKLSSIKQQDRKAQEDAARLLHNFRGDARTPLRKTTPAGATSPAADPNAVFGHMQADQRFGDESVASLAAGFHQNGAPQPETPAAAAGTNMAEMFESMAMADTTPPTLSEESPVFVEESVAPMEAAFIQNGVQQDAPAAEPKMEESTESMVMVGTSPKESPVLVDDGKQNAGEDDWVSVVSSNVPSPEKVEDVLRDLQSFDSADVSRAVTEIARNMEDDDDDSDATPLTEAQLHAAASRGGHLSLRLDVEFSFGLVSNDLQPNVDKYMKGVASIAHTLFIENRLAGRGGHAIFNASFEPFVRFVEDDSTAAASPKRFIVHASLPIFILDWAEAPSTRVGVRNALKAAIQDGRFLSLARL
jgi:hypothetical protein